MEFFVRVICKTYNQSSYIGDTMDGFCMQQTHFPFLCVIADDASTDGEPDVIKKYLDDNFDKQDIGLSTPDETDEYVRIYARHKENKNCYFCVLLLKYNHYSIRKAKLTNIAEFIRPIEYIVKCEGDDYWTDPLKLQKQVDFLEEHDEYALSFHDAKIVDAEGNLISDSKIKSYYTENMCKDWSELDLMCGITPPTPTVMYRGSCYYKANEELIKARYGEKKILNSDTVITSVLGKYGKGKFHDDIANSVSRVQRGGIWQMKSDLYKSINQYKTYTFLQRIHKNRIVKRKMRTFRLSLCSKIVLLSDADKSFFVNVRYYLRMLFLAFVCCDIKIVHNTNKGIIYNIFKK